MIRRFLDRDVIEDDAVRVGPGDDAAVISAPSVAVSCDISIEDVHFRRDWLRPEEIGYRAAAAALSDMAAMAARPIGILVALAVPTSDKQSTAERVIDGVHEALALTGGTLLGGDLTESPGPLIIDVTTLGSVDDILLRSAAEPGDEVWVTGTLGGAAAAVAAWRAGEEPPATVRAAFARPVPRVREARWLAEHTTLHALIDLSDGLAGDLAHLAAASGVAIVMRANDVPVHPAVSHDAADESGALHYAIGGGEDYELCFTAPAGAVGEIAERFEEIFDVELNRVGTVQEGEGVRILRADGRESELDLTGFQHFEDETP